MVLAHAAHETVFTVLAEAARRRGTFSLAAQFSLSSVAFAGLLVLAPQWWSVAMLAGAFAAYAAWGLAARAIERPVVRLLSLALVTTGTALAVVGTIGLAFTLFSGTGNGTYSACGDGARTPYCQAWSNPPKVSGPIR